jgi:hypothetical protein
MVFLKELSEGKYRCLCQFRGHRHGSDIFVGVPTDSTSYVVVVYKMSKN